MRIICRSARLARSVLCCNIVLTSAANTTMARMKNSYVPAFLSFLPPFFSLHSFLRARSARTLISYESVRRARGFSHENTSGISLLDAGGVGPPKRLVERRYSSSGSLKLPSPPLSLSLSLFPWAQRLQSYTYILFFLRTVPL